MRRVKRDDSTQIGVRFGSGCGVGVRDLCVAGARASPPSTSNIQHYASKPPSRVALRQARLNIQHPRISLRLRRDVLERKRRGMHESRSQPLTRIPASLFPFPFQSGSPEGAPPRLPTLVSTHAEGARIPLGCSMLSVGCWMLTAAPSSTPPPANSEPNKSPHPSLQC